MPAFKADGNTVVEFREDKSGMNVKNNGNDLDLEVKMAAQTRVAHLVNDGGARTPGSKKATTDPIEAIQTIQWNPVRNANAFKSSSVPIGFVMTRPERKKTQNERNA